MHGDVGVIATALPFVQTILSVLKSFNIQTSRVSYRVTGVRVTGQELTTGLGS